MAGAFKGVRIGPSCLACQRTIDARNGLSLSNPRGARGAQRQGFLHSDCQTEQAKKFYEETVQTLPNGRKLVSVVRNLALTVPVYSEEEIDEALRQGAES